MAKAIFVFIVNIVLIILASPFIGAGFLYQFISLGFRGGREVFNLFDKWLEK